jgi:large subunit ribosomal protein L10
LTKAAGLFQAPLSQMARLAEALKEKKPAGDEVAPAAEAPAAEAPAADVDTDAAVAADTTDTDTAAADAASDD